MKIHPKLIGFDIDGVVADTMEAFIRLAAEDYGVSVLPEDITRFQVEKCLDVDLNMINEIFDRLLFEPEKSGLMPMDHAPAVLEEFSRYGPLTFITARPHRDPIAAWLKATLGHEVFKKVRLVATGEHDGKVDYVREMDLQYFVDDRAQTCRQLADAGISPIVFQQPWNAGRHELQTVDNWLSIRELCFV